MFIVIVANILHCLLSNRLLCRQCLTDRRWIDPISVELLDGVDEGRVGHLLATD